MKNQYTIFYSWQSDDKESSKTLGLALENTVEELNQIGIKIIIQHSTLGEPGMPSIDQAILRKIDACDLFIADVTPVTAYDKTLGNRLSVRKEVPNPNVLLELGYAMSALGVEYVIVAAHQGKWIPQNMPFDINHHAIYSFNSSNCDLTARILGVIDYIKKNGKHRYLDKPSLISWIVRKYEKLTIAKTTKVSVISEESTVFFRRRMAEAFPGYRGLVEFTKTRDIKRHLSKLLESPLFFHKNIIGVNDPVWWFRAGSGLYIKTFKHLKGRKFLIGHDEFVIRRIVAFIDNGRYYLNYVYVETQGEKTTGLYGHYTPKCINRLKECLGNLDEEYAIYKPCAFIHKKVTKQEEDDGATKICGKLVKMKREYIESRNRHLVDYNFIIAAKESAFNNDYFNQTSEEYFKGLLEGSISIEEFHNYMKSFTKPDREM